MSPVVSGDGSHGSDHDPSRGGGETVRSLRIGARRSPLAVAQAEWVAARFATVGVAAELIGIDTQGDTDRRHLTEIGGTGVFAMAVRSALLDGVIDVAVHSLKDLPTAPAPGLEVAAIPEREDPRDVLVGRRLDELADGMVIGTGSPRRRVQLEAYAVERGLELEFVPIRGNVDTRLGLVRDGRVNATVLAAAGLRRLGRLDTLELAYEFLDPAICAPAAGQGALAVEIATAAAPGVRELVARLDHPESRAAVTAERAFLRELEAGCLAPVGVLADRGKAHDKQADLTLCVVIGRTLVRTSAEDAESDALVRLDEPFKVDQATEAGQGAAREGLRRLSGEIRPDSEGPH